MGNRKNIRERGKLRLSRYFQVLKNGESVAILPEKSLVRGFPKRLQGRTGVIVGNQGKAYRVKVEKKTFLITPIHLKKVGELKNDNK